MDGSYVLALDQGTSSSRAVLFNRYQQPVGVEQQEFEQLYPADGWVEHDPETIWTSQLDVARRLITRLGIKPESIAAVGITNQRETVVVWDRETGRPIHNAIVWQDRRTAAICDALRNDQELVRSITRKTGLVIDSYFSATKLAWILDNVPGARARARAGKLAFGTIDTWLLWKLTGGMVHATDPSNASRTMLFNIQTMLWDDELLECFAIPRAILPEILPSASSFGFVSSKISELAGVPISGILGDQQASLFGQRCFNPGELKNTYGTGCFMLMNLGQTIRYSASGLITTVAWQIGREVTYAMEGSVFIAGAAIKWLRDGIKLISSAAQSEQMAMAVPDTGGVYLVPAFSGLGAPYWDMYARGVIVGLTQSVTDNHLVRAALESVAYQTRDIANLMESETGISISFLKADGGASANRFLMQFQSDILNIPVQRSAFTEITALGAALIAGLAVGFFSKTDIDTELPDKNVFNPTISTEKRIQLYSGWQRAVLRAREWAGED